MITCRSSCFERTPSFSCQAKMGETVTFSPRFQSGNSAMFAYLPMRAWTFALSGAPARHLSPLAPHQTTSQCVVSFCSSSWTYCWDSLTHATGTAARRRVSRCGSGVAAGVRGGAVRAIRRQLGTAACRAPQSVRTRTAARGGLGQDLKQEHDLQHPRGHRAVLYCPGSPKGQAGPTCVVFSMPVALGHPYPVIEILVRAKSE